jgi:hypothetical protein
MNEEWSASKGIGLRFPRAGPDDPPLGHGARQQGSGSRRADQQWARPLCERFSRLRGQKTKRGRRTIFDATRPDEASGSLGPAGRRVPKIWFEEHACSMTPFMLDSDRKDALGRCPPPIPCVIRDDEGPRGLPLLEAANRPARIGGDLRPSSRHGQPLLGSATAGAPHSPGVSGAWPGACPDRGQSVSHGPQPGGHGIQLNFPRLSCIHPIRWDSLSQGPSAPPRNCSARRGARRDHRDDRIEQGKRGGGAMLVPGRSHGAGCGRDGAAPKLAGVRGRFAGIRVAHRNERLSLCEMPRRFCQGRPLGSAFQAVIMWWSAPPIGSWRSPLGPPGTALHVCRGERTHACERPIGPSSPLAVCLVSSAAMPAPAEVWAWQSAHPNNLYGLRASRRLRLVDRPSARRPAGGGCPKASEVWPRTRSAPLPPVCWIVPGAARPNSGPSGGLCSGDRAHLHPESDRAWLGWSPAHNARRGDREGARTASRLGRSSCAHAGQWHS